MISSSLFSRYARALADVTLDRGEEAAVQRDLDTFRELFRQVPALLETLDSPAVPREAKEKMLQALMARFSVCPSMRNFLRILQDHHRIRYFAQICDSYVRTVNERNGIVSARVTSARPLEDLQTAALRAGLATATGKQIDLSLRTDPELLGGVIVQMGSTVYDGSIRTQLETMRRRLARE